MATSFNAPLKGILTEVYAPTGQSVKKGDKLGVLSTLKMEIDIKAEAKGVVEWGAKRGDTIEEGAFLVKVN